ncbi:MAG: ferredoxin [Solirubrobacteraceae bacterium]|jgi:NAD-dependent dihydropyrimidine dehydrogenase PreA subunit|nr:ferredoxin [Solirubrobacteraceae bacterium]
MRSDAIFIGIEVDDAVANDPAIAAKLTEVCPVDIYADAGGKVEIVEQNIDECILCAMCIKLAPQGVRVHKLYSDELLDAPA